MSGDFFDRFLNEYYAESEEHLASTCRSLLQLEESIGCGGCARMQEFGATVTTAGSPREALAFLRESDLTNVPHIVTTDIGMPQADGFEFLVQLRQLPRERGGAVPAIAVTAYAGPADRERALAAGFKMHLEKPVAPLALAAAIARVTAGAL